MHAMQPAYIWARHKAVGLKTARRTAGRWKVSLKAIKFLKLKKLT